MYSNGKYEISNTGGVLLRKTAAIDGETVTHLKYKQKVDLISSVTEGDTIFAEVSTGGWIIYKKDSLITCKPYLEHIRKYKILHAGGASVRNRPSSESPVTGVVLPLGTIVSVIISNKIREGNKTFLELGDKSGWIVQQSGQTVVCEDIAVENTWDFGGIFSAGEVTKTAVERKQEDAEDEAKESLLSNNNAERNNQSIDEVGQRSWVAPKLCCDTIAPATLLYQPENPSYQISNIAHYVVRRRGIWNDIVDEDDSNTYTIRLTDSEEHVYYSVDGVALRLNNSAMARIKHFYKGEPLLVTFHERGEVQCVCPGISCFCCADPETSYRDDTIEVKGLWFGNKDVQKVEPTLLSSMGCFKQLSTELVTNLTTLNLWPHQNNCLHTACPCCVGTPLINHISIDIHDCDMLMDRPRILSTRDIPGSGLVVKLPEVFQSDGREQEVQ